MHAIKAREILGAQLGFSSLFDIVQLDFHPFFVIAQLGAPLPLRVVINFISRDLLLWLRVDGTGRDAQRTLGQMTLRYFSHSAYALCWHKSKYSSQCC